MKKKHGVLFRKLLLAFCFIFGGAATFYLSVDRLREKPLLYTGIAICAIVLDLLFFRTLFSLMREKEIPNVFAGLGRLFSVVFRGVARIVERVSDTVHRQKTLVEGKTERTFVFETREGGESRNRRKLPRLPKNAGERERIRHEYAVYVFKRDKNIPAHLTPSEVERRLDETGEDHMIFERYNGARYDDGEDLSEGT